MSITDMSAKWPHNAPGPPRDKAGLYERLLDQARDLLSDGQDQVSVLANASALLYWTLPDLNWAGFYLLKGGRLVLGPFQGKPACVAIEIGRGVCGTAALTMRTQVVPDVHLFEGHIACDPESRSEIVVPLVMDQDGGCNARGRLIGVMDLDSPRPGRFDEEDRVGLERFARVVVAAVAAVAAVSTVATATTATAPPARADKQPAHANEQRG